jgi:hypothetical protein
MFLQRLLLNGIGAVTWCVLGNEKHVGRTESRFMYGAQAALVQARPVQQRGLALHATKDVWHVVRVSPLNCSCINLVQCKVRNPSLG